MSATRQGILAGSMALVALAVAVVLGYALWSLAGDAPAAGAGAGAPAAASAPGGTPERPALVARPGSGSERLGGTVVDASGTPIAGAAVTAELELGPGVRGGAPADAGPGGLDTTPVVVAISDASGRFALDGLAPGRHRLRVEGDGLLTAEIRFVDAATTDLRLVVARQVAVRGEVVDEAGAPAAGVSVRLASETSGDEREVTSDERGQFAFEDLAEGRFVAWAIGGERAAPAVQVDRLGAGPFAPLRLELAPAEIVRGQVVDAASGRGVPAWVTLRPEEGIEAPRRAIAGGDGSFAVPGILPGRWIAEAEAPGYVAAESLGFTAGRGFAPVLRVARGGLLAGVVVDEDGAPVAGAYVAVRGQGSGGEGLEYGARRAATGSGRLVPRGELGVLLGPIPYPPPPGATSVRVATPVDREADAQEVDEPPALEPELSPQWTTDADGRFRATGLAAGRYHVTARHPDRATAVVGPIALGHGQRRSALRIEMPVGAMLVGSVSDDGGAAVAGAAVTARFADGVDELYAVTSTDGRYELGPVARPLTLEVSAVGHAPASRPVRPPTRAQELTNDFVLPRADATIRGRVVDASGFGVAGAAVAVGRERAVGALRATTDDSGRFEIARLPEGEHALRVEHPDFPPLALRAHTGDEAAIELPYGGGASLEVVDAQTGARLAGAGVSAEGPGGQTASGTADEAGAVTLAPLAPGRWTLSVEAPGYVPATRPVEVAAGDERRAVTTRDLRVELSRGATVAGEVRDENGERVAGAEVRVGSARARTDEEGWFRIERAPPGEVSIEASRGQRRGALPITLAPGDEVLTVQVDIAPES